MSETTLEDYNSNYKITGVSLFPVDNLALGSESRRHATSRRRVKVSIVIPTFEKVNLKEDLQIKSKARSRSRETVLKTSASEQLSTRRARSYSRAITAMDENDNRQEIANLRVRRIALGPMMQPENFASLSERQRIDNPLSQDRRLESNKPSSVNVIKRPRSVSIHRQELSGTYVSAPKPQVVQKRPITGSPLVKKAQFSSIKVNMMRYMSSASTATTQQDNSDLSAMKYIGIHQGTAAPFNMVYKKILSPERERVVETERKEHKTYNSQQRLAIDYQSISQSMLKVRLTNQLFESLLQDRDEHVNAPTQSAYQTEMKNSHSIVSFRKSTQGLANLKNIKSASGNYGNMKMSREASHNLFSKRKKIPLSNYPMNTNVLLSNLMRDNLRQNK